MTDIMASAETNDLVFVNGRVQSVSGSDQVAQAVRLTLQTFQGEWFADLAFGVPWFTKVLGQSFNPGQIQLTVTEAILGVSGVASIEEIKASKSGVRGVTVEAKVLTTDGEVAIARARVL